MLETDYEPVRRLLDRSRASAAAPVLESFYETCIEHTCLDALRDRATAAGVSGADVDKALLKAASARVRKAPIPFMGLALREYWSLWALYPRSHPSRAPEVDRFVAEARPLPLERELPADLLLPAHPARMAYVVRPAVLLLGVVCHGILLAYLIRVVYTRKFALPFAAAVAVFSSTSVVSVLGFNALLGVGGGRYTMGMWPSLALMCAALLYGLLGLSPNHEPKTMTDK